MFGFVPLEVGYSDSWERLLQFIYMFGFEYETVGAYNPPEAKLEGKYVLNLGRATEYFVASIYISLCIPL